MITVMKHKRYVLHLRTCLHRCDESGVALVVLPVDVKVRALGESDDHVHVTMVTRYNQPSLEPRAEKKRLHYRL